MVLADDRRGFAAALTTAARERSLKSASGWVFRIDGEWTVALSTVLMNVDKASGDRRVQADVRAKPRVVDDILWTTMSLQDELVGPRLRANRRINGAFSVLPALLQQWDEWMAPGSTESAMRAARLSIERFDAIDQEFRAATPDLETYLDRVTAQIDANPRGSDWQWVVQALTMVAIGDADAAARVAREQIAAGHQGGMSATGGSVWQLLLRDYEAGSGAFAPGYVARRD